MPRVRHLSNVRRPIFSSEHTSSTVSHSSADDGSGAARLAFNRRRLAAVLRGDLSYVRLCAVVVGMMNVLLSGLLVWREYAAPAWCLAAMRRGLPCCTWTVFVWLSTAGRRAGPGSQWCVFAQPERVRGVAVSGDPQRLAGHLMLVE